MNLSTGEDSLLNSEVQMPGGLKASKKTDNPPRAELQEQSTLVVNRDAKKCRMAWQETEEYRRDIIDRNLKEDGGDVTCGLRRVLSHLSCNLIFCLGLQPLASTLESILLQAVGLNVTLHSQNNYLIPQDVIESTMAVLHEIAQLLASDPNIPFK